MEDDGVRIGEKERGESGLSLLVNRGNEDEMTRREDVGMERRRVRLMNRVESLKSSSPFVMKNETRDK